VTQTAGIYIDQDNICGRRGCTDPGFPVSGDLVGDNSPYDVAVNLEPTTNGAGQIIQGVCYTITSHGAAGGAYNIDPDALNNSHWYVRLQRTDGGQESAKTMGFVANVSPCFFDMTGVVDL